ncbi:MAG: serine/threonine protein kinase [Planctomycetes bacterium]|nr:serine/threonine protein kinase [Planctomycetota bacterium]
MAGDEPLDEHAILGAFLQELLADRQRGADHELAFYQARYPGFEAAIAREFARVAAESAFEDGTEPIRGPVAERYREEREIAAGGMGTIYRVWDPSLERGVAKKVLGTRWGEHDATAALSARFLGEAKVTAQLDHPGIVPVHELGLDERGRLYFTMSLVRGRSFSEVIDSVRARRDGWTRTRALGVLQRVCEAVAYAHSKGVIHRDLKPANVMVGPFGQAYVLDWGLARLGDVAPAASPVGNAPTSPNSTHAGDVIGTPAYMAPEQARGDLSAVGPRSDVYALGAMLYHLLTGQPPYGEVLGATSQRVLDASLAGPPTPVRAVARDVPEELVAIQERAMARDPVQRYASAADLGDDLRAFLETRVVRAHRTGAWAELTKWVRRNKLAAAAAMFALVSLAAGLAVSTWQKRIADDNVEQANAVLDFLNKDLLAAVAPGAVGKDATIREVLDVAAEHIEGRFPDRPLVEAAIRRTLAETYRRLGEFPEAERHALHSVELYRDSGGDAEPMLDARRVLATVYRQEQRLADAERENREILALSRSAFGDEHVDTLTAANNLGLTLTNLGRYDEAERLLADVYRARRRLLGVDHDHTLVSMCNLGLLYYNLGRHGEAAPLIKGELDLCTAKNGEEDPGTLISMNNWANLLDATGRREEALEQHERICRISAKVCGERHPRTLDALISRAVILYNLDRWDETRELLATLRERTSELGPDDRVPMQVERLEAKLLFADGDAAAAAAASERALAHHRRVLGDSALLTSQVWRTAAQSLAKAGRTAAALRTIDEAIAALASEDSLEGASNRFVRGEILADLERFPEAENELLRAIEFMAANAPRYVDHASAVAELIAVYERTGQADKAADWRARRQ